MLVSGVWHFLVVQANKSLSLSPEGQLQLRHKLPLWQKDSLAFSVSFSSRSTSSEAMPILQARGLPPKVEPCSPGLIPRITSSDERTAETGNCARENVTGVRNLRKTEKTRGRGPNPDSPHILERGSM